MTEIPTARAETIDSSELGMTLMVEHIFNVNIELDANWPELLGDEDERIETAIDYLTTAKQHGIDTIVDRTLPGIGRDVARVKRVAERSPVNIIVSTGYYTWRDLPHLLWFRDRFEKHLENPRKLDYYLQRDIEEGIGDTGVRAGILKAATDRHGLDGHVEYVLRQTARVHRRTGVPISTHTNGASAAKLQERIFDEEGVDLNRVYYGHIDKTFLGHEGASIQGKELDSIFELIDAGGTVSVDMLSAADIYNLREKRIDLIVALCERGNADRVITSHDMCAFTDLLPEPDVYRLLFSNHSPWTELPLDLLPTLRERGVTEEQIEQMTVRNPRRLLESRALGAY